MSSSAAALRIEPVASTSSSNRTLPGPSPEPSSKSMRRVSFAMPQRMLAPDGKENGRGILSAPASICARRRLHAGALDLLPARLDRVHRAVGQRDVIEALGHVVALVVRPFEELERSR